jgi:transcriptional regulator with XRE-family HTH domain
MANFLAKNLKYLRKKSKLSQSELAKALNFNRSTYANWESGQTQPAAEEIAILSEFHNLPIEIINRDLSNTPNINSF